MRTLEQEMLKAYELFHKDVYKHEPWIFPILSASAVALHAGLWYFKPPRFIHPATFYIALVGDQNVAKSSLLATTESLFLHVGYVHGLPNSTPEKLQDNLSELVKEHNGFVSAYVIWDEAGALIKKLNSYMDQLPYLLNKAYYSHDISFERVTKKSAKVPRGSYILNMYFTALPEQWAQIEELAAGGFSRRVLPIHMTTKLPYLPRSPDEEIANPELLAEMDRVKLKVRPYLFYLQTRKWFIGHVKGIYTISDKLESDPYLPPEKRRALSDYIYKIIIARALANLIPVQKGEITTRDYNWLDEQVRERAEKFGVEIRINEDEKKKNPKVVVEDLGHPPFIRTIVVDTIEAMRHVSCDLQPPKNTVMTCQHDTHMTHMTYNDTHMTNDTKKEGESSNSKVSCDLHDTHMTMHDAFDEILEKATLSPQKFKTHPVQPQILAFVSPLSPLVNFVLLRLALLVPPRSMSPDTAKVEENIRHWLEENPGKVVVSTRTFAREILHLGKAADYEPVINALEASGAIRRVFRGINRINNREMWWIILDTSARICGNCRYFRDTKNCPRLKGVMDPSAALKLSKPYDEPCDKFKLFEEDDVHA